MNIIIGLKFREPVSEEYLADLVKNCKSSRYNVDVRLYDYSIAKQDYSVATIHKSFEDFESANDQIFSEFPNDSFGVVITPNLTPPVGFLDWIDFDYDFGSVYVDYTIKGVRIFLKSPPVKNTTIPLIFCHSEKANKFSKNKEASVFSEFISKHIPISLCSVE